MCQLDTKYDDGYEIEGKAPCEIFYYNRPIKLVKVNNSGQGISSANKRKFNKNKSKSEHQI